MTCTARAVPVAINTGLWDRDIELAGDLSDINPIQHGRVMGVVSIGDIVKSRLDQKIQENTVLQDIARAQFFAN
jgi:hypothetical protein